MSDDAPGSAPRLARLLSAIVAVLLALFAASAVTAPLVALAVRAGLVAPDTTAWQLLRTVVQFAGFLAAALGYLALTDQWDLLRYARPTLRESGLVAAAAVGLLTLQYGSLFALSRAGLSTGQNQAVVPAGDPVTYYLAMIVVSLLIVGPVEEVLFRGVVQGGLRRAFTAAPSILVAGGLFGVIHLVGVQGTGAERWAYVAIAAGLGCILGYLYERTENLVVPGLAHGAYNATIYALLLADTL
jgi:membrane protease YdiL (CAAX protease family)